MDAAGSPDARAAAAHPGPPLWLLAELTYRCPLHCVFCSNPVDYAAHREELDTAAWCRVLDEARALGAVQLGLSGGEPLLRDDLEDIVAHAHRLGYYVNLITSGIGLTEARAAALQRAGLDHVQLSFQDSTRELNDFIGSSRTFDAKARVAAIVKGLGYPMVLNCVMHRYNLPHVGRIIQMAEAMGADFLELANTQYYGWAWLNREALMPGADELADAEAVVDHHRARLAGRMKIFWVAADYAEARPKPCMNGWGSVFLVVAPDGLAMPCHGARMLPGLELPSVTQRPLDWIWHDSGAFNRWRGDAWMPEPCAGCADKARDFGGCRCQAHLLAGDASATDPVCARSPHHATVQAMVQQAAHAPRDAQPLVFRPGARRRAGLVWRSDAESMALVREGTSDAGAPGAGSPPC